MNGSTSAFVPCAICGARVVFAVPGMGWAVGAPGWMADLYFLTIDEQFDPSYISLEAGYLINTPPNTTDVEPEVYNSEVERFVRSGVKICPIQPGKECEIYDGRCYPIHEACWQTFEIAAVRVLGIPRDSVSTTESILRGLMGVFDAGKVLEAEKGGYRLGFAHGFGDELEVGRYWRRLGVYGVIEIGPVNFLEVHKSFEREPLEEFVYVGTGEGGDVDSNKVDVIRSLKNELGRGGMEDVDAAVREDGYWVPAIDGLPVEILSRVLEFLGGEGVIKYGTLEGVKRRVKVPEGVWKREFEVRDGVGWVDGEGYWKGMKELSWFERFLNVRLRVRMDERKGTGSLRNWRRVFGVCMGVLDVIFDVGGGRVEGLENTRGLEGGFKVLVPKGRGGAERGLRVGGFKARGVMVSYTGSGKMRFVSGMRFLPGGEGVGIVNLEDEVYCELFGKVDGSVMVLKVCFGEFGIRRITTEGVDGVEGGVEGQEGVSLVRFLTGPGGVDVNGVSVCIDAYKITGLGIDFESLIL
ncbi:hypothetical protein TWF506_000428 [Arthrobotrys conoides]|uniref:Uncharacterized protein n=1 Tax=Arthrobotrys conoides TaxID=74498 RepID=A0AAN8NQY1_9PEZI